jgi:hypothetical protein
MKNLSHAALISLATPLLWIWTCFGPCYAQDSSRGADPIPPKAVAPQEQPPPPSPTPPATPAAPPVAAKPTTAKVDLGKVTGHVYTNSQLGFSIGFPKGWRVLNTSESDAMMAKNEDRLAKEDPTLKIRAQKSRTSTTRLLTVASMLGGTMTERLGILTDDYGDQPGEVSAERIMKWMVWSNKARKLPIKYLSEPKELVIGDRKLWKATWTESDGDVVQYAIQYVMTEGNRDVQFILVSSTEAGVTDLEPIMKTLKFFPPTQ